MTNREKFAEQILNIACMGFSIAVIEKTMMPVACTVIPCYECKFNGTTPCERLRKQWCDSEYVEPPIDWSKVPVDTPILVRNSENEPWRHRYFAKYENNRVYAWCGGATSWSAENNYASTTDWGYGKLAEESEQR